MMHRIKDVIEKRKSLDVNDEITLEQCWVEEAELITSDITSAIEFINNECDDETLYWLSEVLEDVVRKKSDRTFLEAVKKRAEVVRDEKCRESINNEIRIAEGIINQKAEIDDEIRAILKEREELHPEDYISIEE